MNDIHGEVGIDVERLRAQPTRTASTSSCWRATLYMMTSAQVAEFTCATSQRCAASPAGS